MFYIDFSVMSGKNVKERSMKSFNKLCFLPAKKMLFSLQ